MATQPIRLSSIHSCIGELEFSACFPYAKGVRAERENMRYSLSQLKRDAAAGKIKFEMIERYGKTGDEIPERLRGIRSVARVNTVGIMLVTEDGTESELRFDTAKLTEYDGKTLTIYDPAERELTFEEREVLESAQKLQDEYEKKYPYGDGGFWKVKHFISKSPCPWMDGNKTIKGKRYNYNGKVIDYSIRGKAILKYIIHSVV